MDSFERARQEQAQAAQFAAEDANRPWMEAFNRYDQQVPIRGNNSLGSLRSMAMLNKSNYVGDAGVDVGNQSQLAMNSTNRRLLEMGVNPSAGRYAGSARSAAIDAAAQKAAAMTRAGRWVDQENFGRMNSVAGLESQNASDVNRWRFQNKANQLNSLNTLVGLRVGDMAANNKARADVAAGNAYSLRSAINRNNSTWDRMLKR